MARVTFVKSARASKSKRTCFTCGTEINEGDSYRWFASRIGRSSFRRNYCVNHNPRPSHMTTSDKLSQLYAAQENVEDALEVQNFSRDDIALALNDAAEQAKGVGEEYTESADNIEDGFGHETQMSEEIREKAENCEEWASTLEEAAYEVEQLADPDSDPEHDEEFHDRVDAAIGVNEGDPSYEEEWASAIESVREEIREEIRELATTAIYELML
jgi:hypothetical protein